MTKIELKRIEEFREVLRDYHVSKNASKLLEDINIVALSSVAAGGRNTIINHLVKHYDYHFVVSDTTRPPKFRDGKMEEHGVNYFFRTEEELLHDLQAGKFLEAEIIHNQQVSGTSIRELERAKASGKIPIAELEFGGIENLHNAKPDAHIIGLLPPSYEEWIERFKGREEISDQEFYNRLETAQKVLSRMLSEPYFTLIINDTVEQCVETVRAFVERDEYSNTLRKQGHAIAEDMLQKVNQQLTQLESHGLSA